MKFTVPRTAAPVSSRLVYAVLWCVCLTRLFIYFPTNTRSCWKHGSICLDINKSTFQWIIKCFWYRSDHHSTIQRQHTSCLFTREEESIIHSGCLYVLNVVTINITVIKCKITAALNSACSIPLTGRSIHTVYTSYPSVMMYRKWNFVQCNFIYPV